MYCGYACSAPIENIIYTGMGQSKLNLEFSIRVKHQMRGGREDHAGNIILRGYIRSNKGGKNCNVVVCEALGPSCGHLWLGGWVGRWGGQ